MVTEMLTSMSLKFWTTEVVLPEVEKGWSVTELEAAKTGPATSRSGNALDRGLLKSICFSGQPISGNIAVSDKQLVANQGHDSKDIAY
jgi:hypothetical protein